MFSSGVVTCESGNQRSYVEAAGIVEKILHDPGSPNPWPVSAAPAPPATRPDPWRPDPPRRGSETSPPETSGVWADVDGLGVPQDIVFSGRVKSLPGVRGQAAVWGFCWGEHPKLH